jgi:hypothetical protein
MSAFDDDLRKTIRPPAEAGGRVAGRRGAVSPRAARRDVGRRFVPFFVRVSTGSLFLSDCNTLPRLGVEPDRRHVPRHAPGDHRRGRLGVCPEMGRRAMGAPRIFSDCCSGATARSSLDKYSSQLLAVG